jgi:hypothetical protein
MHTDAWYSHHGIYIITHVHLTIYVVSGGNRMGHQVRLDFHIYSGGTSYGTILMGQKQGFQMNNLLAKGMY